MFTPTERSTKDLEGNCEQEYKAYIWFQNEHLRESKLELENY